MRLLEEKIVEINKLIKKLEHMRDSLKKARANER